MSAELTLIVITQHATYWTAIPAKNRENIAEWLGEAMHKHDPVIMKDTEDNTIFRIRTGYEIAGFSFQTPCKKDNEMEELNKQWLKANLRKLKSENDGESWKHGGDPY